MTRMLFALTLAAVCSVTAAGQTPAADTSARDSKMMKGGPVSVTGCVAETTAGEYTLTNAMMANKDNMSADKMPADMKHHDMTYRLSGGTDLKAHVGHKVQVTGTMGKMDKMATGQTAAMDKDRAAATSDKAMMKPGNLTVTSVKMISATCP